MTKKFSKITTRELELTGSLLRQEAICGNRPLAEAIAAKAVKKRYRKNKTIIKQGAQDSGIHFILSGKVDVQINRTHINTRRENQHVGEMATIEPHQTRSATVTATEDVQTALLSQKDFFEISDIHPEIWKPIALTLNQRLRDRASSIRVPNKKPKIFIGSSSEGKKHAEKLKSQIECTDCEVTVWTDRGFFELSHNTLTKLEDAAENYDFAILILGPDDKVISRKKMKPGPRDNLLFELGLFMGTLKKERAFFVSPNNIDLKLPSDLFGITNIRCNFGKRGPGEKALKEVADAANYQIKTLGPRRGYSNGRSR